MTDDISSLIYQPRFVPPEGWDWSFRTLRGIKIRYGQVRSRKVYKAVAVMFQGLGDFGEQYFELVRDLDARDIKLIIIDLPGQGGSGRYLKNPHKRHSAGFDELLADLHNIVDDVVLSAAVDMEDNHKRLPIVLLAHSMGGHLALRYLKEYNKSSRGLPIFTAAAMVAPMIAIKAVESFPKILAPWIVRFLALRPGAYIPGGADWSENYRMRPHLNYTLSSDPERGNLHKAFFKHPGHQHLVIGSPTTKWLADAEKSCRILNNPEYLSGINTPVLMAIAGNDILVSNDAIREAAKHLPKAELLEIPAAHHEILMETDELRGLFLDRFFTFINENVLMKPNNGKIYIQ